MTITIYSTPTCKYCDEAKKFLKKNKIDFEEVDVQEDLKAREEMIEKSGGRAVPVIDVNGTVMVGFDRHRLAALLDISEDHGDN